MPASLTRGESGREKDRTKILNWIFFLSSLAAYSYFSHFGDWNSNSRFALTLAIVERGDVSIDVYSSQPEWLTGDVAAHDGHIYSSKPPGSSLLGAFYYLPIHEAAALLGILLTASAKRIVISILSSALPSALCATMLFILAQRLAPDIGTAFWASLGITAGTLFWPYSSTFFGHALAASALFVAFYIGFLYVHHLDPQAPSMLLLLGLALGIAFITEYTVAVIIVWILGYVVYQIREKKAALKALLLIGLGSLPALLLAAGYNYLAFGKPLAAGYGYSINEVFMAEHSQGLFGIGPPNLVNVFYMTLHPGEGIFWLSPVLLLVIPGTLRGLRSRFQAENVVAIGAFATMLLTFSGFYSWWGAWAVGPRYLVPMLPFLVIPLCSLSSKWKPHLRGLAVVSTLGMFIVASTTIFVPDDWVKNIASAGAFAFSTFYSYVLPRFLAGNLSDNLVSSLVTWPRFVTLLPFMYVEMALMLWFWKVSKSSRSGE